MDGIHALDLWDLIVTVLHGNTYQNDQVRGDPCKLPMRKKSHGMIDDLDNVDLISSNVHSSRQEALLYIFEDNEAVIKMIIKGRSQTMRHISSRRFLIETAARKSGRNRIGPFLSDLFKVRYHCPWYLLCSSGVR